MQINVRKITNGYLLTVNNVPSLDEYDYGHRAARGNQKQEVFCKNAEEVGSAITLKLQHSEKSKKPTK